MNDVRRNQPAVLASFSLTLSVALCLGMMAAHTSSDAAVRSMVREVTGVKSADRQVLVNFLNQLAETARSLRPAVASVAIAKTASSHIHSTATDPIRLAWGDVCCWRPIHESRAGLMNLPPPALFS